MMGQQYERPTPSPQGFPGSTPTQPPQSMMPVGASRPMTQLPQVPVGAALPNIVRSSPMMLDLFGSDPSQPEAAAPPGPRAPTNVAASTPPLKHPATIKEEESQFKEASDDEDDMRPAIPTKQQIAASAGEEYDEDDDESISFLSYDELTEDNTEYNAIVDYDLLDMIMGGSTDYDAPMPRASHTRKVNFNTQVKAQSLVRVLKEGEVPPSQGAVDPDTDTEFESESMDEAEDEYEEEEEEEWDDTPPSPVVEVLTVHALRPPVYGENEEVPEEHLMLPPEITPRGVSLKMDSSTLTGSEISSPDELTPLGTAPPPDVTANSTATSTDDTSPTDSTPTTGPRKKVRHVQIQTRGATMKHQQTMTDLTMATDLGDGFSEMADLLTGAGAAPDPRVTTLEAAKSDVERENAALRETIAQLQAAAAIAASEREEAQARYETAGVQTSRRIKELVNEKTAMEVEMDALRVQVKGLEDLVNKWTMDEV
ncbi:hypothetical protein BCR33DRAFT_779559 [Rhizoclosmatium globosum]|uniref:Uncharacterized protein n=1 Tax=Rhizoclosmatium globosum TaxID=329046 RepID=A0A1Y2D3U6_9FUNG|nr:hypothetical protein BCR33DRAFT_779559 [Rhizoclosmatium globosum]|eukprot:ORY53245.1 hypothetical protein BCR33DRAFT_779559 [Rhizoclosmatium globosum]